MNRVLLVEDDFWVARIHREMVEQHQAFVVVAHAENLKQATALLQSLEPDLILLDVYLPDGRGLDWLQQLRQQGVHTEVILITSANDSGSVQQGLHLGVTDYLLKPFEKARLNQALGRFLMRQQGKEQTHFNQHKLDQLMLGQHALTLPRGIDGVTLQRVRDLFTPEAALTSDEVARFIGTSRITAWRYLEHLLEQGFLEVHPEYGNVGRPTKRYQRKG
ncbi:response regulator [Deinococcus cellulosilyticus]|uniref:Transcriptional regulatory protein n=1 Tax=Deinococcus cellulosilyticus (strain DSM 18568 / NBRC 106333 / KACC 11606 / 5516J-15) TaxID=1223518 RepID=A0A511N078_DEIC1|nr:response regulator [Deinococcus cellulosilyticus]GEM46244.1 transcriptional regulatory protein [Deinococcus cellulosilyticus NBRC 106333 = KACC 11606]